MKIFKKYRDYLAAYGIFIGMTIGAGFFSLPYSISRSGLIWGAIHFLITFFVILFLHILYGFIVFSIPGKHRFIGYVRILLGNKAEKLAFLNTFFSYYGTFAAYAILAGFFIFNIFPFFPPFNLSLFFLILCGFFIFFDFKKIGEINFYLTIPLLISIIFFLFLGINKISMNNFLSLNKFYRPEWFLPYGIFLFSFSGFSVIPEVCDFFREKKNSFKDFKKTIKISQIIIALFYLVFLITVLGVSGAGAEENIIRGIQNTIGRKGVFVVSFAGLFAVLTSTLALVSDFKNILYMDYKISKTVSFFLFLFPLLIFLFLTNKILSLTAIISIVGGIGLGIFGLLILFMAFQIKKNIYPASALYFLTTLLVLGALLEVWGGVRKMFS